MTAPLDDDGVALKHNDYITFSFGIPPTCVIARLTQGPSGWGVECIHPHDVIPRRSTLADLTKYYQIWKASKKRVNAIMRNYAPTKGLTP